MQTQKFNKERLVKYATYLSQNDLTCKVFFEGLTEEEVKKEKESNPDLKPLLILPILELPLIFKGEWQYDEKYLPVWKGDPEKDILNSITLFFGINELMLSHVFSPGYQLTNIFGGVELSLKSHHEAVAKNIFDLIRSTEFIKTQAIFKNHLN